MWGRARLRIVAVAALAALPVPPALTAAGAPHTDTAEPARAVRLRVVSYNMHAGTGTDGRLDPSRTAATLAATRPDVVALQEVDVHWSARSDWRDQASDLAAALGMRVFFAPVYSLDAPAQGRPRREYGLAVLSRHPVVHAENHEITRLSTQTRRPTPTPAPGLPEVVVNAAGARVHVYATHLDHRADPAVRRMQVADMLRVLAADPGDATQVLAGDLNATPEAAELAPLWDRLTDAWTVAGDGAAGPTYPAQAPVKRIDYVTVSPGAGVVDAHVPPSDASDHLPVVATLTVRRGR